VDPDDTADPAATRAAIAAASFVVALELRATDVTRAADVVFPVAPVTDKAGTFVTWEGRPRPFEAVFTNPASLPDLRILAGIAEELAGLGHGHGLGFRTVAEARAQMRELGGWDGERAAAPAAGDPLLAPVPAGAATVPGTGDTYRLATWKQMLDNGSLQDGDDALRATARRPVARLPRADVERLGDRVTVTGDRGWVTLPAEPADLVDGVVWLPANSFGRGVLADLASPGTPVTVKGENL
jgi:NADH-quinone oxidoreductase subunit G